MEDIIMNEEIMNEDDVIETEAEETGMGAGMAMLIGAGLTLAGGAGITVGKRVTDKTKARKELRQPSADEVIEVTDEDIDEIAE